MEAANNIMFQNVELGIKEFCILGLLVFTSLCRDSGIVESVSLYSLSAQESVEEKVLG